MISSHSDVIRRANNEHFSVVKKIEYEHTLSIMFIKRLSAVGWEDVLY